MQHFVYPAILTPDEHDGGFVVTFPDVPEAITQGDDVSDALQHIITGWNFSQNHR